MAIKQRKGLREPWPSSAGWTKVICLDARKSLRKVGVSPTPRGKNSCAGRGNGPFVRIRPPCALRVRCRVAPTGLPGNEERIIDERR